MHVVTSAHPMAAFGLNGQLAVWLFHPVEPPVLHDIPTLWKGGTVYTRVSGETGAVWFHSEQTNAEVRPH